jgi:hemerythrin-like domain-containing protein
MTATTQIQTTPTTETPDTTTYYAVHRALRDGARKLHRAASGPLDAARIKAIARYWKGYAGEVLAHHTTEDSIFFPALVARVPVAADLKVATDADHHRLDELMAIATEEVAAIQHGAGPQALVRALAELAELMEAHLDFEDADIVPLFARHFTADEYKVMEDKAIKLIGVSGQAAFSIPFVVTGFEPADRERLIAETPMPVRVIYRLFRGRYARLEAQLEGRQP